MLDAPTLHPRFEDPTVLAELRARWDDTRRLRIEDALAPGLADALHEAALGHRFSFFEKHEGEVRCVFWRQLQAFADNAAFTPIALAERLFTRDVPALASAISGQALHAVDNDGIAIDYYTRGSYLDAHTDAGPERLVAYVVGLTRERWPPEDGGHLEFLAPDARTPIASVPPGFGSLDLFCIHPLLVWHRIPLLLRPVTRLSVNGWLGGELAGPGEA